MKTYNYEKIGGLKWKVEITSGNVGAQSIAMETCKIAAARDTAISVDIQIPDNRASEYSNRWISLMVSPKSYWKDIENLIDEKIENLRIERPLQNPSKV